MASRHKALAAIRLAFARLPDLEEDKAYPLFIAETALDSGLSAHELLHELGYGESVGPLLKWSVYQPRVPKGNGDTSGEFAPIGAADTASVIPVFLDTEGEHDSKVRDERSLLHNETLEQAIQDGHALDFVIPRGFVIPLPLPTPGAGPSTATDDKDKDRPDCPDMRADRARGPNAAGDSEEYRVAQLVNPSDPTPKRSPTTPNVVSMGYYLPVGSAGAEVAHDDCKKTTEPSPGIADIKKGDMLEIKTSGSAALAILPWTNQRKQTDAQIERQVMSIRQDGKGRHQFICVGAESNVPFFEDRYAQKYEEVRIRVCQ